MLDSWTTPAWEVGEYFKAVHRIFESALVLSDTAGDTIRVGLDETGLVDVVAG